MKKLIPILCLLLLPTLLYAGGMMLGIVGGGTPAGGGGGYATPAMVGTATSVYDGSTKTITRTVAANSFLVLAHSGSSVAAGVWDSTTAATTAGPGTTSAWTEVGHYTSDLVYGKAQITVFWAKCTGAGAITVTITTSSIDPGQVMHEYTGVDTTTPIEEYSTDVTAGADDVTFATGNITMTTTNGLLFAYHANEAADQTITISNWTNRTHDTSHWHQSFDRVTTSTGEYNFAGTFNVDGEEGFIEFAVGFKAAAL